MKTPQGRETYEVVSVRLPYRVHQGLLEVAELRGITMSQLLRDCIKCYSDTNRQVAVERGLIDSFGNRLVKGKRK